MAADLVFEIFSGFLALMNFMGNSLVCFVIVGNKSMRTPLNFLLLNLAVADILVGVLVLPVHVFASLYQRPRGLGGQIFCKIISSENISYMCGSVSEFTLVFIAYERYQAVVHPLKVRERITKLKTLVFIVLTWIVSFGVIVSWFFWIELDEDNKCDVKPQLKNIEKSTGDFLGLTSFAGSLLAMCFFYGRVLLTLRKTQLNNPIDRHQLAANRVKNRVVSMLCTVTILFALCWGSYIVVHLLNGFDYGTPASKISWLLIVFNSSINGFLYALFSDQFKNKLRQVYSKCCCFERMVRDEIKMNPEPRHNNNKRISDDCGASQNTKF